MKKRLTLALFILSLGACRQNSKPDHTEQEMDSIFADFFIKWRADSLGQLGFRMNHYDFEKSTRTWRINGMTFKGYSKAQIVKWLGEPRDSGLGHEDHLLIMVYTVRRNQNEPDKDLILYFDEDNNLDDIIEETGMPTDSTTGNIDTVATSDQTAGNFSLIADFDKTKNTFRADTFKLTEQSTEGGQLIAYHSKDKDYVVMDIWLFGETGKNHSIYWIDREANFKIVKRTDFDYDKPYYEGNYKVTETTEFYSYSANAFTRYNSAREEIKKSDNSESEKKIKGLFVDVTKGISIIK